MNRSFRSTILLMLVLCLLSGAALAEPSIALGAEIALEGTLPESAETFTVRLTAVDGAPMPGGEERCEVKITGAGKAAFPEIEYSRVGVYNYTIEQLPGRTEGCKYDASLYRLTVYVVNAADGDGLELTAILFEDGEEAKQDSALFINVYPTVADPGTVTPTGVDDRWPWYLAGCAALLLVSGLMIAVLRRKNGEGFAPAANEGDLAELYHALSDGSDGADRDGE